MTKRYSVSVHTVFYVDVEAENEEEAINLAAEDVEIHLSPWNMPSHDIHDFYVEVQS